SNPSTLQLRTTSSRSQASSGTSRKQGSRAPVRISSISLAMSCSATSRAAAIMFITTTAPRCCSSALGLSSRACRISSQCTVCRGAGPTSSRVPREGFQLPPTAPSQSWAQDTTGCPGFWGQSSRPPWGGNMGHEMLC
uniref:Uncharacterized protein n=1 Tax=Junco hyemalis TaxID=40217 RepID=A0A8C5ICY1_JUNHY